MTELLPAASQAHAVSCGAGILRGAHRCAPMPTCN